MAAFRGRDSTLPTPYPRAAPDVGHLDAYPGDQSAHRTAGYGRGELMPLAADGKWYEQHEIAVDADRTPPDPEEVAGAAKPDPWEEDPDGWAGTEPVTR
jgi:hypothetical protein